MIQPLNSYDFDAEGFALAENRRCKVLLEKTYAGAIAREIRVETRIIKAMSDNQLKRVADRVAEELNRRSASKKGR